MEVWGIFASWIKADRKTWTERLMLVQIVGWIVGIMIWIPGLFIWIQLMQSQM